MSDNGHLFNGSFIKAKSKGRKFFDYCPVGADIQFCRHCFAKRYYFDFIKKSRKEQLLRKKHGL